MRICIVSLNAYDLLSRNPNPRHCGGAERQQELLARGFAGRGHEVSFITWDLGQADGINHDGVTVYKTCRPDAGLPGLRFFVPRWSSLCSALARADAEIYYQQMADSLTGQVARWARANGRRFVFMSASDSDCEPGLPGLITWRERALYLRGLPAANVRIAQTRHQQAMFREHFDVDTHVIPSIGPMEHGLVDTPTGASPSVLWVGRIDPVKRLDWLLDIADACPGVTFHVVGGSNFASDYAARLADRAKATTNVEFHGRLSRERLVGLYESARLLLCTSSYEGFPNTFLEAWSVGMPVVTTVDPDNVVADHGLGAVGDTTDDLAALVAEWTTDSDAYRACRRRCYDYFLERHTVESVLDAHAAAWDHLAAGKVADPCC